jgi:N-acetylglucosaminyl-diphospho-decaprenol L-rhamnosyltransferase
VPARGDSGTPAVTVAVVSHNTRELLVRCLRSLAGDVREGRAAVWVIDNRSSDGSAAAARAEAPWARVLELQENIGFGRAVNLVAAQTETPWLACANADVALEPGALSALLAAGAGEPRVGAIAPRLLHDGGRTQHSVYPLPTLAFTLSFNLGLHVLSPRLADRLCLEGYWDPERPRAVPWAIGALLMFRREALAAVGGFDERQWMYAEDLDLGWRLHDAGWITAYIPQARVHHVGGAATAVAFGEQRRARFTAETYAVIARRRGQRTACVSGALNVLGAGARLAWSAPLAVVSGGWRERHLDNRSWLSAHLQGLRSIPFQSPWGAQRGER